LVTLRLRDRHANKNADRSAMAADGQPAATEPTSYCHNQGVICAATSAIVRRILFGEQVQDGFVLNRTCQIYSLFPATKADTYGEKYATTNAGLLYTAKGTAVLLVPFSSILSEGGQWHVVFHLAAAMAILAGVLAVGALKPMRQREIARSESISGVRAAA
jgi:hypothetical protein